MIVDHICIFTRVLGNFLHVLGNFCSVVFQKRARCVDSLAFAKDTAPCFTSVSFLKITTSHVPNERAIAQLPHCESFAVKGLSQQRHIDNLVGAAAAAQLGPLLTHCVGPCRSNSASS